ncbi:DUF4124 domain-containing protein [Uliginosibacterium gangwonense]|uniref:DUF4124 domain-containing protein n=1 Tax=Uliginosibacterium gangwonense TaxID=392736 RepID=UPI00039D6ACC|nr:DUF4124 domain-containing protein [Uliginosibacterium gangwonense]
MPKLGCLSLMLLVFATGAQADIYKCVDEMGHTTYTNDKPAPGVKGCALMSREQPISTVPSTPASRKSSGGNSASSSSSPAGFPKVDESTQKSRDGDRRKILEQEKAKEQQELDAARKALAEQEAVRNGDEKNYQKYLDRVQGYKDAVQLHERNVEAINKEIANLR